MKILLLNTLLQTSQWENQITAKWPPLGIGYIAAVLEKEGHTVKIIERSRLAGESKWSPQTIQKVDEMMVEGLKSFNPDFVGITATTPQIMDAFHTASLVKKTNDKIEVIIGGCHPTAEPELSLEQCKDIDVACRGEGEFVMLDLVEGKEKELIKGITYRKNGKIISNSKRETLKEVDQLPYPARHLFDREFYFSPNAILIRGIWLKGTTIFTARGCPYKCAFCQSDQLAAAADGPAVRFHSVDYIISEIEHLIKEFDIEALLFAEDMFSAKRKRVFDICSKLIEKGLNKKLVWAANMRVDAVDEEILGVMKKAGCIRVIYGCESGSQTTLDRLLKKTTVEKNMAAIAMTKKAGITCEANIMIGLPDEKPKDFIETINFLKKTKPDRINRGKLCLLPGTAFYYEYLNKGIEKPSDWATLYDKYTLGDLTFAAMSNEDFEALKRRMDREITLPTNYLFAFKTNIKRNPKVALQQLALMVIHVYVLYLPVSVQKLIKKFAEQTRIKSRYVFK